MNNYIVSLTTIPSKFDNLHLTIDSILSQSILPKKIVINIPKIYNFRMNNSEISLDKINDFINKYSAHNVCVNLIDKDYGPGTKLLGLLNSSMIDNYEHSNTYIILVDDDVIYKPFMIEHFDNNIKSNNIQIASFYVYNFDAIKRGIGDCIIRIGQGVDGFLIKLSALDNFLPYYNLIQEQDYINYHDDFYISYFFHLIKKEIYYIQLNCIVYDKHPQTYIDALYHLTGKYSRDNLNNKIYNIVTELNRNGCFDFLKS
jgi:hypothetical protein